MNEKIGHIKHLLAKTVAEGLSFAAYQIPDSNQIKMITGELKEIALADLVTSAFVICPFADHGRVWVIEDNGNGADEVADAFIDDYYKIKPEKEYASPEKDYVALVEKGKQAILDQQFKKVVLARQESVCLPADFCPAAFFIRLAQNNPRLFVSLHSSPRFGTWIGASPELLLESNEACIQSMSLAGTLINDQQSGANNVLTEKEINEQEIVSEYIRAVFLKLGLDIDESAPELVVSGNLRHLQSILRAKQQGNIPVADILKMLHPTPAICGFPKDETLSFILDEEQFDRQLFGGYLGMVKNQYHANLYVNLRCMQVYQGKAMLFAGAGILKDSDPHQEWLETVHKMDALRLQIKIL